MAFNGRSMLRTLFDFSILNRQVKTRSIKSPHIFSRRNHSTICFSRRALRRGQFRFIWLSIFFLEFYGSAEAKRSELPLWVSKRTKRQPRETPAGSALARLKNSGKFLILREWKATLARPPRLIFRALIPFRWLQK